MFQIFRDPETTRLERSLESVLKKASEAEQEARNKGATTDKILELRSEWAMEIDIAQEELDWKRTRRCRHYTDKYDVEMPTQTDHPEFWEERRYGTGYVLNTKGRSFVRELIRTEQKHTQERIEFWMKNILMPLVGWIVAIIAILFRH